VRLGAIADEFSTDLEVAAAAMRSAGLETAELRVLWGKNILDVTDEELDRAVDILNENDLAVDSIASPLLKCTLPDAPPVDTRFQRDVFASKHTFADQARLSERAFAVAKRSGAPLVRVFSFWRTVDPDAVFERIVHALRQLAEDAKDHGLVIGLENEHACNISTARDTARVLAALDHPNLKVVWDPANAYIAGERPFPDGYQFLPVERIAHVHAKDCRLSGHAPEWTAIGDGQVDWAGQIAALAHTGYSGDVNLETHWMGPNGDKLEASRICAHKLRQLAAAA
jgi:sugar phosphate isomerase/epimerase